MKNDRFGFSTGALEKGDFRKAIHWMLDNRVACVELSALRLEELEPLVDALSVLAVEKFSYVSFHAPSWFPEDQEARVVTVLKREALRNWNIIVHPDMIYNPSLWEHFGDRLLIENMDRRKGKGRTTGEIKQLLELLPLARLCLDVAHARQLDTTLYELREIAKTFQSRIGEVHISELDSHFRHLPLSSQAIRDYQIVAHLLRGVPVIIESMLDQRRGELRCKELELAMTAMNE